MGRRREKKIYFRGKDVSPAHFFKAKKRGKEEESSCKERREKTDLRPSYVQCTKLESPVFPRKGMKRNRLFFPLTTHFPPAHLTKSVDFSLFLRETA